MISTNMLKVFADKEVTQYSKNWYGVTYCNTTGVGTIKAKGSDKVICRVQPMGFDGKQIETFTKID